MRSPERLPCGWRWPPPSSRSDQKRVVSPVPRNDAAETLGEPPIQLSPRVSLPKIKRLIYACRWHTNLQGILGREARSWPRGVWHGGDSS